MSPGPPRPSRATLRNHRGAGREGVYTDSMDRVQLIKVLEQLLPSLRKRYEVEALGLFGSRARTNAGEASDVDLLVRFKPGTHYSLMTLARIRCDIEDAIGAQADLVVDRPDLRPSLRHAINRDLIRVA